MTAIDHARFKGHSPTPWCIAPLSETGGAPFVICDHDGSSLGSMEPGDPFITPQTAAANAELCAAAPTLLARCKALEEENARLRSGLINAADDLENRSRQEGFLGNIEGKRLLAAKADRARAALAANKEKT